MVKLKVFFLESIISFSVIVHAQTIAINQPKDFYPIKDLLTPSNKETVKFVLFQKGRVPRNAKKDYSQIHLLGDKGSFLKGKLVRFEEMTYEEACKVEPSFVAGIYKLNGKLINGEKFLLAIPGDIEGFHAFEYKKVNLSESKIKWVRDGLDKPVAEVFKAGEKMLNPFKHKWIPENGQRGQYRLHFSSYTDEEPRKTNVFLNECLSGEMDDIDVLYCKGKGEWDDAWAFLYKSGRLVFSAPGGAPVDRVAWPTVMADQKIIGTYMNNKVGRVYLFRSGYIVYQKGGKFIADFRPTLINIPCGD